MKENKYSISEAAKLLEVENHVLRYWEEELELNIPRNELGHRYYREEEIQLLHCIKELKNKGFQLKAVKEVLPDLEAKKLIDVHKLLATQQELEDMEDMENIENIKNQEPERPQIMPENREEDISDRDAGLREAERACFSENSSHYPAAARPGSSSLRSSEEKMQEFEEIMGRIIGKALYEQAENLGDAMGGHLCDKMLREMDELMAEREEREELRFKKLDEAIRSTQKARQEIAAAKDGGTRRKSLFFRKNKRKV